MKIIITFMTSKKNESYLLNDDISIKEALAIIVKNDHFTIPENCLFIYSRRKNESISLNYTFKQAEIYSGDILEILENGGEK